MPFPWPRRHVRHAAISAARAGRQRAQADAARAGVLRAQIEAMASQNHFAEIIAADIIRRHSRGGGGGSDTG